MDIWTGVITLVEMQFHKPLSVYCTKRYFRQWKSWRCLDLEIDDFYPLISGVHLKMIVENENDRIVDIGELLETSKHVLTVHVIYLSLVFP